MGVGILSERRGDFGYRHGVAETTRLGSCGWAFWGGNKCLLWMVRGPRYQKGSERGV